MCTAGSRPTSMVILAHTRDPGAVTAARALRRAGWRVGVGSSRPGAGLAGASGAVSRTHLVPRPTGDPTAFVTGVREARRAGGYAVVVGSGDDWMAALSHHRDVVGGVVAHPAATVVAAATDKLVLADLAVRSGLGTPATRALEPGAVADVALPVVVKNRWHWSPEQSRTHRIETAVCSTRQQLAEHLRAFEGSGDLPVLQEPVEGHLAAVIGVMHEGRLLGRVQQVSPRLFPTPSGASARARTVPVDPELAQGCETLLQHLGWTGLVELQFLVGADGTHRLIDLNGRFFGSLALSERARPGLVDAGLRAVCGMRVPRLGDGRAGVRYQWLAGDLRRARQERRGGVAFDVAGTLWWGLSARHSVAALTDPGPVLHLLAGKVAVEQPAAGGSAPAHLTRDLERDEALRGTQQGEAELVGHRGHDEGQRRARPGRLGSHQPHGIPGEQGGAEAGRRGAA